MGAASIIGMLEMSSNLDSVLKWHLQFNHYPSMIDYINLAKRAISHAEMNEFDCNINLKEITGNPACKDKCSVRDVMDGLHLWEFVE